MRSPCFLSVQKPSGQDLYKRPGKDLCNRSLRNVSVQGLHKRCTGKISDLYTGSLYEISNIKGLWLWLYMHEKCGYSKGQSEPNVCGSWNRLRGLHVAAADDHSSIASTNFHKPVSTQLSFTQPLLWACRPKARGPAECRKRLNGVECRFDM